MAKYKLVKVAEFPALGGHSKENIHEGMIQEGYGPTSTGVFTVEKIEPHRSYGRWANSAVPWMSETKIDSKKIVFVKLRGQGVNFLLWLVGRI